jgi:hypothetical protein
MKVVLYKGLQSASGMNDKEWLFDYKGFKVQLCLTRESKEMAYRLRYRAYRHANAIPPSSERMLSDAFDDQPNTRTHLIWHDDKPIASVRSSIWSNRYGLLPTESTTVFRKEVARSVGMNEHILESAHFVIAPELESRESFYAQLMLYRIQDLSSRFDDCPVIMTAVQEHHVPFYERVLGFRRISMPKTLDWIEYKLVLLRTTLDESREFALKRGMPECTPEECRRYSDLCNTYLDSMPRKGD